MLCGTDNILGIYSIFKLRLTIFNLNVDNIMGILSVPHNSVMGLNNVARMREFTLH
jgi:hypothetical protein